MELGEVGSRVLEDVEVQEDEDEDVAEEMVQPPETEGIPRPELLVEHLNRAVDDLVEKHWDQG